MSEHTHRAAGHDDSWVGWSSAQPASLQWSSDNSNRHTLPMPQPRLYGALDEPVNSTFPLPLPLLAQAGDLSDGNSTSIAPHTRRHDLTHADASQSIMNSMATTQQGIPTTEDAEDSSSGHRPRKPRARQPADAQWQLHKARIEQLYMRDNLPLASVKQQMEHNYRFFAT